MANVVHMKLHELLPALCRRDCPNRSARLCQEVLGIGEMRRRRLPRGSEPGLLTAPKVYEIELIQRSEFAAATNQTY